MTAAAVARASSVQGRARQSKAKAFFFTHPSLLFLFPLFPYSINLLYPPRLLVSPHCGQLNIRHELWKVTFQSFPF